VDYTEWDLGLVAEGTYVQVELRGPAAFVRLLNADNYQAYLDGDGFRDYHGYPWEASPMVLEVPYDDHWYVILDHYEGDLWSRVTTLD
jgi:hypothetical protein